MIRSKQYSTKRVVDLDGPEGNAWNLLGIARNVGKQLGHSPEVQKEISDKMMSGNYINLLKTFEEYFGDFVILETTDKSLLEELK